MEDQPIIMVQIADATWTSEVVHSACALARSCSGRIALVQMIRVKHFAYLGTELGYFNYGEQDACNLQAYADTVEDYGVACDVQLYQYWNLFGAIVDAVELVGASVVFAKLPASIIPLWSDCEFELLRRRLARQHCELVKEPVSQAESLLPSLALHLTTEK
jgi:hypothetical protein